MGCPPDLLGRVGSSEPAVYLAAKCEQAAASASPPHVPLVPTARHLAHLSIVSFAVLERPIAANESGFSSCATFRRPRLVANNWPSLATISVTGALRKPV